VALNRPTSEATCSGNVVALAEVLGHANLDMVMVYAHMAKLITEERYWPQWLGSS